MKYLNILLAVMFFVSCNDTALLENDPLLKDYPAETSDATIITAKKAAEVAEIFFRRQDGNSNMKSSTGAVKKNATVATIKDGETPAMYVLNYPEGGFAVIGASKDYYPVLAFSEENSFVISEDMGPVQVWLDETKEAIRMSDAMDEETKRSIKVQWLNYETMELKKTSGSLLKSTSPQDAMNERINELYDEYASDGWTIFIPLSETFYIMGSVWYYLMNMAYSFNSDPDYTIVALRQYNYSSSVGPLCATAWHQYSPFNDLVPNNHPAGCAAIAMGQIMKKWEYPNTTFNWNGYSFNWSTIPNNTGTNTDHRYFIRLIGSAVNMTYMSTGSWTVMANVVGGFQFFGYNVSRVNHNASGVGQQIKNYQRPVLMQGFPWYGIDGHYWVCDGSSDSQWSLYCFIEFIKDRGTWYTYHTYDFTSPESPSFLDGNSSSYFHMNWGWQNGKNNGWYIPNYATPDGNNFTYYRENLYVFP